MVQDVRGTDVRERAVAEVLQERLHRPRAGGNLNKSRGDS